MKDDPAIDAIRKVRHEMSAAFGHDPRKLVAYLRKCQERHRDRLLTQPKPPHAEPANEENSAEPKSADG